METIQVIRCVHCMADLTNEGGGSFCTKCGKPFQQVDQPAYCLRPFSILRGKYLVGRMLGQGGFGITYIGLDLNLESKVAIKECYPGSMVTRNCSVSNQLEWSTGMNQGNLWRSSCESFLREARKMAKMQDIPAVVRVRDTFEENNTAYIVMDFVEGITLKQWLEQNGTLTPSQCVGLLRPMISALESVHRQGFIHRDISPDNIMLQSDGGLKLLDLGAAKDMERSGGVHSQLVTKNGFSPVEQYAETGEIGPWTDIYALCATMYYCMTGKPVTPALDRIDGPKELTFDPRDFREPLPAAMASALQDGLALNHKERIQSATELLARLDGVQPPKPKPKPVAKVAAACAAALLLITSGALLFRHFNQTVDDPDPSSSPVETDVAGEESDDPHERVNSLEDTILSTHERNVLLYTIAIEPQYDDAGLFSDGLAPVKKNGKWGYIDVDNNVVIPFEYEMAWYFNEGYAVVAVESMMSSTDQLGYRIGFVDTEGNYTPFSFNNDDMWIFVDDYDSAELLFHNGWIKLRPAAYQRYYFDHFFDTKGNVLDFGITPDEAYYWIPNGPSNEGLIPIRGGPNYYGWADYKGNIVKIVHTNGEETNTWTYPGTFNQGLAPVTMVQYDEDDNFESQSMGFVDKNFQWVIEPEYLGGVIRGSTTINQYFGDIGLAMMAKDGKVGAIDKKGNTVILFRYDELWIDSEGLIMYCVDGKYGYIDADTLAVSIPAQFEMASSFNAGFAVASDGEKTFLIDRTGTPIPGGDTLDPSTYFTDNGSIYSPGEYVVIQEGGKYGFGHIEYYPDLPERSAMDSWAYEEAASAIAEELIPVNFQNLYRHNITRGDMCSLITTVIERILDVDMVDFVKEHTGNSFYTYVRLNSFQDSDDGNVIACNALNIVKGESQTVFNPYGHITRQEAAAILQRTAEFLGMQTGNAPAASISDAGDVLPDFTDSVNYVLATGIMDCGDDDAFDPLDTFTRQEAFVAVYRLLRVVTGE